MLVGAEKKITWLTFEDSLSNFDKITLFLNFYFISNSPAKKLTFCFWIEVKTDATAEQLLQEIKFDCIRMKFLNHTNCQIRDKHTVGGIVFYKHAFLVSMDFDVLTLILSIKRHFLISSHSGALVWNSVPLWIKNSDSVKSFTNHCLEWMKCDSTSP